MNYSIDVDEFQSWLETMGSYALDDLLKSLENGNLDAAKAHGKRIQMIEYIAPWVGLRGGYLGLKMAGYIHENDKS